MERYKQDRKCPKCGSEATARYRGGYILRTCANCHYEWDEEPLDKEAKQ